jgi:hypothetical protein
MAFDGLTNGPVFGLNTKRNAMIPVIAKGTSVYSGISYDVDAYNYIRKLQDTPGVTLPEAWKKAINKFYVRLKQIGAYDQIDIMYLFIGGNAAAHKIEGKNPGGPYDITWNGAVTHSVNGVAGGVFGSTVIYGNTNFNLTTNSRAFTQSNASMGVYIRSGTTGYPIGASDSASNPISTGLGAFVGSISATTIVGMMNNPVINGIVNATITSNRGFLVINRTGNITGTFRGYRRGYSVSVPASPSTALLNLNVYVAAINRNGTPFSSPSVISFAYVGSGKINPMEMAIVVDNLQQALGRSIYT